MVTVGTQYATPQRSYEAIAVDQMEHDPARAAVRLGLVDVHSEAALRRVGAWRWPLMQKHADALLGIIEDAELVFDFGGLAGPLGYGSMVVDYGAVHRSFCDIPQTPDAIFSSHTLEHIPDLDLALCMHRDKLAVGGRIVAHVPSWRTIRWRAENWPHHHHTFSLAGAGAPEECVRLDRRIGEWAEIELADDDHGSLIVVGRKR